MTKTSYASGEKVKVKITAKNGSDNLSKFAGKVTAKEEQMGADGTTVISAKNITLEFKSGVAEAEFEVKAGAKSVKYTLTADGDKIASAINCSVTLAAVAEAPGTATKYAVADAVTSGSITITAQNDAGDTVTSYAGTKSVKVTVKDVDGVDVTSSVLALDNGTAQLTFTSGVAELSLSSLVVATYEITVEATDGSGIMYSGKVQVS